MSRNPPPKTPKPYQCCVCYAGFETSDLRDAHEKFCLAPDPPERPDGERKTG